MIKKISAIFILALLFTGFASRAQPVFSITAIPVDSMTLGADDRYLEVTNFVINQTTSPLSLNWQLITDTSNFPSLDWTFVGIADNFLVRLDTWLLQHVVQKTAPIAAGDSTIIKLIVRVPVSSPNGSAGLFKIKFFDSLQTQVDTGVYRICKGVGCIFPAYRPGEGTGASSLDLKNASVSLYPNPAADRVYVQLRDLKMKPADVSLMLYDYTGRLVVQQQLNTQKEELNLQKYSPGMYFIKLYHRDNYLGGQKIIKQ